MHDGFVDKELALRFEAFEARYAALYARAALELRPGGGADVLERAGAVCAYVAPGSPLSHVFGLGLTADVSAADLEAIEEFYRAHGDRRVQVELCPHARRGTLERLGARGYRVTGFEQTLARPLDAGYVPAAVPEGVAITIVDPASAAERAQWVRVAGEGFFHPDGVPVELEGLFEMTHMVPGVTSFLATVHGTPAAAAALAVEDGLAALFGGATLPAYRRAGAHGALLDARLAHAARAGAVWATAGAAPGSGSQHNMERHGFRVAYTRAVLTLPWPPKP